MSIAVCKLCDKYVDTDFEWMFEAAICESCLDDMMDRSFEQWSEFERKLNDELRISDSV